MSFIGHLSLFDMAHDNTAVSLLTDMWQECVIWEQNKWSVKFPSPFSSTHTLSHHIISLPWTPLCARIVSTGGWLILDSKVNFQLLGNTFSVCINYCGVQKTLQRQAHNNSSNMARPTWSSLCHIHETSDNFTSFIIGNSMLMLPCSLW